MAATAVKDAAHPFYLLEKGKTSLSLLTGHYFEEEEYEKGGIVQDLFEKENMNYRLESLLGLEGKRQIGMNTEWESHGELSKVYSPTLNIPAQKNKYSGFHFYEFFLQEHLTTKNPKNKLAFELALKGSSIKGNESRSSYAGHDIALAYHYSHDHDEWRVYGNIRAEIIGDKNVVKSNGEREVINAYSLFGNKLGLQWMDDIFWADLSALFYLTTDYNSSSPSYTRLTDKGFVIGGRILLGHKLSSDSFLTLEHVRQSSSFNVITESTTEGTEFEIESELTRLGVKWYF